jgi:hypothetical protein
MSDSPPKDQSPDQDLVIDGAEHHAPAPMLPVTEGQAAKLPEGEQPAGDLQRVALLMDHYRDTYGIVRRHGGARDRLFLSILVLLVLIAIDGLSRGTLSKVINGYVASHLVGGAEEWERLDFTAIIHLLVDFCLLSLVVRYYQRTMLTTRTYRYLIGLEEQMCEWLGGRYITRHGEAYFSREGVPISRAKERQPWFLRFARVVYDGFFPLTLGSLAVWIFLGFLPAFDTLVENIRTMTYDPATIKLTVSQLGSGVCSLGIAFSSLLYLVWVVLRR